jgi:hypothetical protein
LLRCLPRNASATFGNRPYAKKLRHRGVERYLADLERLETATDIGPANGANIIRNMIEKATVMPAPTGTAPKILLEGTLRALGRDTFLQGPSSGESVVPWRESSIGPNLLPRI